ncbi:hypothetical protein D3C80_1913820 [compost metagenome]
MGDIEHAVYIHCHGSTPLFRALVAGEWSAEEQASIVDQRRDTADFTLYEFREGGTSSLVTDIEGECMSLTTFVAYGFGCP